MANTQRVPLEHIRRTLQGAPRLRPFLLNDVTPTGKKLGGGSYGVVEELEMAGLVCAGKKIYDALIDPENQGAQNMVDKYYSECSLLSELRHPHIVQFLGICFLPDSQLPVLVMERLHGSLDELLETTPDIPLTTKLSILQDVARGLVFLHTRNPAVIHRDLTARNVLLTTAMTAKIADLGNSRITNLRPGQLSQTMTKGIPGTLVYMPPESSTQYYGPPLDMFSFGHLTLFAAIQVFPGDLLPHTYTDPRKKKVKARTELERRENYIATLDKTLGKKHALVIFIKECLMYDPEKRPTARQALERLAVMSAAQQDPYQQMTRLQLENLLTGHSTSAEKIEDLQSQLAEAESKRIGLKEVCEAKEAMVTVKEKEITALKQQVAGQRSLLSDNDCELSALQQRCGLLQTQLDTAQRKIKSLEVEGKACIDILSAQQLHISALTAELKGKDKMLGAVSEQVTASISQETPSTPETSSGPPKDEWEIDRKSIQFGQKLGAGESAEVWEGLWNGPPGVVPVAVKMCKPAKTSAEFLREANIMKKMLHPRVLQLYAVCSNQEPILIITEIMKQGCLLDYLHSYGRSLEDRKLVDMAAQVASGMKYLEEQHYIHLDLAARNILVGDDDIGRPGMICKVAGFGHVRYVDNSTVYEFPERYKFPIKWTAPEAAFDRRFSIKSHVWSFGIVLYEFITRGRMPYPGRTNGEALEMLKSGYRMPCPTGCPKELHDIMLDCWREEPEDRPTFKILQSQLQELFSTGDAGYQIVK